MKKAKMKAKKAATMMMMKSMKSMMPMKHGSLTSGALSSFSHFASSSSVASASSVASSGSAGMSGIPMAPTKIPPSEPGTILNVGFVNGSTLISNADLADVVTALQKQVDENFFPIWNLGVDLRIATNIGTTDAIIYVVDNPQSPSDQGDLGFHDITDSEIPVGFVFVQTALMNNESWQVTASHELLELIADPFTNLAANGLYQGSPAFFAYEVCDAVENDQYVIGDVPVSNFVFPSWFIDQTANRYDYMGTLNSPFSLSPGGYLSYWPATGSDYIEVNGRVIINPGPSPSPAPAPTPLQDASPTPTPAPAQKYYGWVEVDGKTMVATPAATPGVWSRKFRRYSRFDSSLYNLTFRDVYTIDTTDQ